MKLRRYSTPESALSLEITYLAIIEVFVSMAIYVGIALYFDTLWHVAWAAVLVPMTLLRTPWSSEEGIEWLAGVATLAVLLLMFLPSAIVDSIVAKLKKTEDSQLVEPLVGLWTTTVEIFLFVMAIPYAAIIRVGTTLAGLIRRPLWTLSHAPQNWLRQTFCVDLLHPPELVPGIETANPPLEEFSIWEGNLDARTIAAPARFSVFWARLRSSATDGSRRWQMLELPLRLLIDGLCLLAFVPSVIYRGSFKATSMVYGPLIFVSQVTLRNPLSGKTRLERLTEGQLEKTRRLWSSFVLGMLGFKALIFLTWVSSGAIQDKLAGSEQLLVIYVMPDDLLVPWQLAEGTSAALTFLLLWFADAAIPRLEAGAWSPKTTDAVVSATTFTRGLLSIYTVFCLVYVTLQAAFWPDWPELGTNVLPGW